jgi:hypothetical protein
MANPSSFLPTPGTRDLGTKELDMTALRQSVNNMAIIVNSKDSGYYPLSEFMSGQSWFKDPALSSQSSKAPSLRQGFRKVINFGPLPAAGSTPIAHGLNFAAGSTYIFTRIYGAATNPTLPRAIPIPYAAIVAADTLQLEVTATDVVITTGGTNYSAYTRCVVVIEWLQA